MENNEVLQALQKAGRKHFFKTNSLISKQLVPGQYHLYAELAACTMDDVVLELGNSATHSSIRWQMTKLVKAGEVSRQRINKTAFFWLRNTQYLHY